MDYWCMPSIGRNTIHKMCQLLSRQWKAELDRNTFRNGSVFEKVIITHHIITSEYKCLMSCGQRVVGLVACPCVCVCCFLLVLSSLVLWLSCLSCVCWPVWCLPACLVRWNVFWLSLSFLSLHLFFMFPVWLSTHQSLEWELCVSACVCLLVTSSLSLSPSLPSPDYIPPRPCVNPRMWRGPLFPN